MAEACCFTGDDCLDLPFLECVGNGGLPMGPDTVCGATADGRGIVSCTLQACCWREGSFEPWRCDDFTPAFCRDSRGSEAMGRGTLCRYVEPVGCGHLGIPSKCCLADGSSIPELLAEYCNAIPGATTVFPGEPCPPPPVDEDCRFPEPDVEVGPVHSTELCAKVGFQPALAGAGVPGHRAGYGSLLSVRGVRNDANETPCKRGVSTMFLDARRYGSPVFCSRQTRFPRMHAHEGTVALQPKQEDALTRPGYGLFVGSYDAPDWSEVTLGSIKLRCWGPLV